jgi:hypothetical protein
MKRIEVISQITPRPLLSIIFPIHYSLFIILFHAIYSEPMIALFIENN